MIDSSGKKIIVGWSARELLYVEAAMTLPTKERSQAYEDIASMTGRRVATVYRKASSLREERIAAARTFLGHKPFKVREVEPPKLPPSQFAPPSIARLMGQRA
jgi:hypothetical protein